MEAKQVDINNYCDTELWDRIREFGKKHKAPFLLIDSKSVENQFINIKEKFPKAEIFYAYKANSEKKVVLALIRLGSKFDAASRYEIKQLLSLGVLPENISYGNTIKKAVDIKYAYNRGIRLFVTDSINDLEKISKFAPHSKLIVRIKVDAAETAKWPLTKKFGCHSQSAVKLLLKAKELGLKPEGVSFHVGSQQDDTRAWEMAIIEVKSIFDELAKNDISLNTVNMGGGFPAQYIEEVKGLEEYAQHIHGYLEKHFGNNQPKIMLEPGRSMVGDSGITVTEVVLVKEDAKDDNVRWIFCDIGKYNGAIETIDECIKYRIYSEKSGDLGPVVLAGPTCDSTDIMYEKYKYNLPKDIKDGDLLYFFGTGAYTSTYCSVSFNGIPPIKTFVI